MTSKAPLKERAVVSCFILKEPGRAGNGATRGPASAAGRPLVALFRRSGRVSTYQHHWAPISGSIEADDATPLAAAWRELREETTLTAASLELIRHGKSFTFDDASIGRHWTIYPFAFWLRAPDAAVRIDWEHEAWAWVDPLAVQENTAAVGTGSRAGSSRGALGASAGGDGSWPAPGAGRLDPSPGPCVPDLPLAPFVPHLATSLRRAWFEADLGAAPGTAGAALARGLDRLHHDHRSGARQLAGAALGVLRDVVQALDRDKHLDLALALDRHIWWAQVRFAAWHIWRNGRESMGAAVLGILLVAMADMEEMLSQLGRGELSGPSSEAVARHIVPALERRMAERARASSAAPVAAAWLAYLEAAFPERLRSSADPNKPLVILTVSESSTVAYALQQLRASGRFPALDLRVLESRPLFEGVSLAASLLEGNADASTTVTVTVYTDASVALAAAGADVVLLGADRVASTGAVSNKTGSLPAALCAKNQQHLGGGDSNDNGPAPRVVVLAETDKIATPGDPRTHVIEENDAAQLTRAWAGTTSGAHVRQAAARLEAAAAAAALADAPPPPPVQVRNVSFEWVPPALIDAYVTEQGVWTVEAIGRHAEALAIDIERVFKDV